MVVEITADIRNHPLTHDAKQVRLGVAEQSLQQQYPEQSDSYNVKVTGAATHEGGVYDPLYSPRQG